MKIKRVLPCLLFVWGCAQSSVSSDGGGGRNANDGGAAAGMSGSGGAAGGSAGGSLAGMGGMASAVLPTADGSRYRFDFDGYRFVVDADLGGRVLEFSFNGKNVLTGPDANAENYGSSFWPSPQSAWNWPPPSEIDPGAYTARVEGGTLVLEGKSSGRVNLAVTKRVVVDRAAQAVVLTYEMKNTGTATATWAPWEITRVPPGGVTFFAQGAGGSAAVGTWMPAPLQDASMWRWFDDAALQVTDNKGRKTFADGKGWIAHLARNQRLLLVKSFEDVAQDAHAADEAELEIFVDGARKYVEVENQGAALPINAGATRSWTVRWALRALPGDAALDVGAPAVVAAAKQILNP